RLFCFFLYAMWYLQIIMTFNKAYFITVSIDPGACFVLIAYHATLDISKTELKKTEQRSYI
ncbi:MAG: hypothetical protein PHC39_12065, partial [Proteiniphilum sp.]|nr:hypothetical protein [Proteiniphilum sp.]MDD3909837.1 hypothetical protein [Proteiniphilum sp.]